MTKLRIKNEYYPKEIRINSRPRIGEPVNITLFYDNGDWQTILTSNVMDYQIWHTGSCTIETENSRYYGTLRNVGDFLSVAYETETLGI